MSTPAPGLAADSDGVLGAQASIKLSALLPQTERFRLHLVHRPAGRLRIAAHHAAGGPVASPPRGHLLRGGGRIWFSGFAPA